MLSNVDVINVSVVQTRPLKRCCSNWSLCVTNVHATGCTFNDIERLVYYNYSYPSNFRGSYDRYTQRLLPYLCNTMLPGKRSLLPRDAMLVRYML